MSIEYIGNEALLLDQLWVSMQSHLNGSPKTFLDLFSGTASVSAFMRTRGMDVTANNTLNLCTTFAEAGLLTEVPPAFEGLARARIITEVPELRYAAVVNHLNNLAPVEGFMFRPTGRSNNYMLCASIRMRTSYHNCFIAFVRSRT